MTPFPQFEFPKVDLPKFDFDTAGAEKLWRLPIGAASPFWAAYAGMAGVGVAYWWASQFMKPINLEAFKFEMPAAPPLAPLVELTTVTEIAAALAPEPVAPPEEPAVAPDAPELKLVEAVAETSAELAEAAVEAADEAAEVLVETVEAASGAVTESAAETMENTVTAVSMAADDLTRLFGVGPTLAAKLGDMGIRTFSEIASWTESDLENVDKALDLKGRAVREKWVDQARQFAEQ